MMDDQKTFLAVMTGQQVQPQHLLQPDHRSVHEGLLEGLDILEQQLAREELVDENRESKPIKMYKEAHNVRFVGL
jgi:hypothetical protein